MRVETILTATKFPKVNNPSYILTIDFGIKKTSVQITDFYTTKELIGKQVIAVVNFPNKQIASIQSKCLILSEIGNEKNVTLLSLEKSM
jgi:tRNA-binding protein